MWVVLAEVLRWTVGVSRQSVLIALKLLKWLRLKFYLRIAEISRVSGSKHRIRAAPPEHVNRES